MPQGNGVVIDFQFFVGKVVIDFRVYDSRLQVVLTDLFVSQCLHQHLGLVMKGQPSFNLRALCGSASLCEDTGFVRIASVCCCWLHGKVNTP